MSLLEIYAYPSLIKPSNEKFFLDFFPSHGKQSKRHFCSTFCPEPSILLMLGLKRDNKYAKLPSYWTKCLRSFSSSKETQRWRHATHSNTDLRAIFQLRDFNRPLSLDGESRPPVAVWRRLYVGHPLEAVQPQLCCTNCCCTCYCSGKR